MPTWRQASGLRVFMVVLVLVALLAVPFQAYAAKGSQIQPKPLAALNPAVTAGQLAAFRAEFENTGTSTITKFEFVASATNATFYWSSSPCSGTTQISCPLGNLAAGSPASIVVVFQANGQGAVEVSGEFKGDAKVGGPGAKVDTWSVGSASVPLGTGEDIYASWQIDNTAANFSLGSGAQQTTQVSAPGRAGGYFTLLAHSDDPLLCENADGDTVSITGYGRRIDLDVAGGVPIPLTGIILFAPQPGINATTIKIVHERDGKCFEVPRNCILNPGDCYDARTVGTGANRRVEVTFQFPHNGPARGF